MDMMYYEYLSALYSYKDSKNQFYKKCDNKTCKIAISKV